MNTVEIMTWFQHHNYGLVLQAVAMSEFENVNVVSP